MLELGILINNLYQSYIKKFSPISIIFNTRQDLFIQKGFISNLHSSQLTKCAVDDFDFIHNQNTDFNNNDQLPFNWDINNLIELPTYQHHQLSNNNTNFIEFSNFNNNNNNNNYDFNTYNTTSSEEFESTLDEELTFINRSKYYPLQQLPQQLPQQQYHHHQPQQQQQPQQYVKAEEFPIDLNDVNSMFDNYLLENELSNLLQLQANDISIIPSFAPDEDIPKKLPKLTKSKPKNSKKKLKELNKPTIFQCTFCPANFKVKGYLTRHLKKHSPSKLFVCPFYSSSSPASTATPDSESSLTSSSSSFDNPPPFLPSIGTKCHPTGGFSRRDTFKTHLKALHFIYPPGTKSTSRNEVGGRCAGCFKFFQNNADWLLDHIEKNECPNMLHKCT